MGTRASAGVAAWSARACDRGWCGRGDGGECSEREHGQRDPVERRSAAVSIDSPPTGTEYAGTSVDVPVTGTASIGLGEADATIIYVMDFSGSTGNPGGACGTILDCEKTFFVGLNAAAVADGSTDEVAVVKFDSASSLALGLTNPTSAAVNTAINSGGPGSGTSCAAGLSEALTQVNATTNGTKIVVFASDGLCNAGANVSGPAGDLATAGAIVQSIAIGAGSSCSTDGGTGTLNQIAQNGGACHEVPDPNNLPNLIQSLIGSTLQSLTLTVDGNASAIPNTEISLPLPRPGATNVTYATTVQNLEALLLGDVDRDPDEVQARVVL